MTWNPNGNVFAISNMKDMKEEKEEVVLYDYRNWKVIESVPFKDRKIELNDLAWDKTGTFLFVPTTSGNVYALNTEVMGLEEAIQIEAHLGTTF